MSTSHDCASDRSGLASSKDHARLDRWARLRINLTYFWRHGFLPDLDTPSLFTEFVQHRKLHDRNRLMPRLADKVEAKHFVASRLGPEWVIPTLWHGRELPATMPWRDAVVVKSRHGCNQREFVRDTHHDWAAIRSRAHRWLAKPYGSWLDEWLYSQIEPGILVEPFVGIGGALPVDYKFYVFGGRVKYVQVHLEREHCHRWVIFDRQWARVSAMTHDADPPRPASLAAMMDAAETLGAAFDFVRADFYDIAGTPLFGELTFYPGSGLDRFHPVRLDAEMGAHWQTADETRKRA